MTVVGGGSYEPQPYGGGHRSTNLADILERVLDKGLVIAGDIQVNLLDIELLTIKLRLVVASLETAKAVGIDWWETDPWLNSKAHALERQDHDLELENRELRERIAELEAANERRTSIERRREPKKASGRD
ncbi:gas vesicle protein [Nocardia brevicatena]|uniref:gas vesicle protein n=1 Tax=Nocardia brevicatena TaxID=37327 RepID=UPI0002E3A4A0|nr:gas vesicle protein GvpJ [Nocardia brevicatena]